MYINYNIGCMINIGVFNNKQIADQLAVKTTVFGVSFWNNTISSNINTLEHCCRIK